MFYDTRLRCKPADVRTCSTKQFHIRSLTFPQFSTEILQSRVIAVQLVPEIYVCKIYLGRIRWNWETDASSGKCSWRKLKLLLQTNCSHSNSRDSSSGRCCPSLILSISLNTVDKVYISFTSVSLWRTFGLWRLVHFWDIFLSAPWSFCHTSELCVFDARNPYTPVSHNGTQRLCHDQAGL